MAVVMTPGKGYQAHDLEPFVAGASERPQRRPNRFTKQVAGVTAPNPAKIAAEAHRSLPASPRTTAAMLALQVVLPNWSPESIHEVLKECDGDVNKALEALLPAASASAQAEEVAAESTEAAAVEPHLHTDMADVESEEPQERWGEWTVVDSRAKPIATPAPAVNTDAPTWLPLMQTGGKDTSSSLPTYYDLQTQRMKAALGPAPAAAAGPSSRDLHGQGPARIGGG